MGTIGRPDSCQLNRSSSLLSGLTQSSIDSSFDHFDPSIGQQKLVSDLEQLVNNKETADVVFIIGEQETPFYLHKLFLWTRCLNFKKYGLQFWRSKPSSGMLTFKYRQYQPTVFACVLRYIYSGQFDPEESSVFSSLIIATELGLPDLQKRCEGFILSRLSVDNACLFLAGASKLESDDLNDEPIAGAFTKTCMHYVMTNASQCLLSDAWCHLPKLAVKRIIQDDQLCLEEDEVWRAVLRWTKFQAGIPAHLSPLHWSDEHRRLAAQPLSGLVEHVKLLLIDSKVFAEEVEPTGAVPMEVSLERYRIAALPPDVCNQSFDDDRLKPRVHITLFHDTRILCNEHAHFQKLLNQWYNNNLRPWKLLFRASRDGYKAEDFHRCCDGFSPTFVIVKGETGNICGGFSDVAWTSNTLPRGRFIPSNCAFLFTLINNQGIAASKFEVSNGRLATLHHPTSGPTFGAGADLCIADQCRTGMHSYSNFPHSYHGDSSSSSVLMGDYYFNVADYEVFTLISSVDVRESTSSVHNNRGHSCHTTC
ncbi:hypothetical protein CAPTEDRAFT_228654 [Capitella teleta]|uniref:BTB domain-containing protein n=1 Tax=Capitella teleta TaxID=283909 RepID=R7UBY7_CAPTE|nr:hypothetical protein CAPTEDRAFT_228654 [Capitella teleta]|eukprot:ELU03885.1 hypothetical protein CAPTEDRAFT_228654 [Capitella teleta]